MIPAIPTELVAQIADGRAALFVGAGLSQGAGLPGWPQLLREMLTHLEKRDGIQPDQQDLLTAIQQGDLLAIAETLRERLRDDEFRRFLQDRIQGTRPKPTQAHRLLQRIPFGVQVTTNYDGLLEGAYALEHDGATLHTFTHQDVPELGAATRSGEYLLKLHGDINRIDSVVLGTTDYRRIMQANPACRTHLTTLFTTRTVLFLGYGLADPDLMLVLDALREHFRDHTATHYALMPEDRAPAFKRDRWEKDHGIRVLSYPPTDGHPEVQQFLESLASQVHQARRAALLATPRITPVERLAHEVTEWLSAIGYQVEQEPDQSEPAIGAGRRCLIASLNQGSIAQRVRVHCIGGEIGAADIEALDARLDRRTNQGWAICDQRVSPQASARAAELEGVQAYRLADFLTAKVWGPYIEALNELVLGPQIPERYVDPACHKKAAGGTGLEGPAEDMGGLDAYMDSWLSERGKVHMSLLGEFGTGKTWFCRHYAWRRLQRYLADPANERLPLLVTLRDFVKTTNPEQLINDLLLERYKLPFVGSAFEVFKAMNRRGKLLLILDGFDEMARKTDYQTVVDNFWELACLVEDESKVILTSRTEYFRWAKESEKVLSGQEYGRKTIALKPPRFEVLYLTPFDDERIRRMIVARLSGEPGNATADKVLARDNLKEMARKPVLTELLLAAIDAAGIDALDNEADIYLNATNRLLVRNIDTQRTFTSTADKLYFLCELAWEMIRDGELRIHYKEIPERIRRCFGERIADERDLDHWDYDLRNQTLLHRNAAGYYEFAHKSLAEFFVALKFASDLGVLDPKVLSTYREADNNLCVVLGREPDMDSLAKAFGYFESRDERIKSSWGFLPYMLDRQNLKHRLTNVILQTRHRAGADSGCLAGNALTLLQKFGLTTQAENEGFRSADLSYLPLRNAYFSSMRSTDLTDASLRGSDLTSAELGRAVLSRTDLRDTSCRGLRLDTCATSYNRWSRGFEQVLGATWRIETAENTIPVVSLAWCDDGTLVAGAVDNTLRSWKNGYGDEQIHVIRAQEFICLIASSHSTPAEISVWCGSTVLVWDLNSGQQKSQITVPELSPLRSGFAHEGDKVFGPHVTDGLSVFDVATEERLATLPYDTKAIAAAAFDWNKGNYVVGTQDGRLVVWKSTNCEPQPHFLKDGVAITALCLSEDATTVFAAGIRENDNRFTLEVWCWNLASKGIRWYWESETFNAQPFGEEINERIQMKHSVRSGKLAIVTGNQTSPLLMLESASGRLLFRSKGCPKAQAVAFNPPGTEVAVAHDEGAVSIWNSDEGTANFGTCLRILDVRLDARGAQIAGAKGLDESTTWRRQGKVVQGTRLEFLADCGAILDDAQLRLLAQLRENKPPPL